MVSSTDHASVYNIKLSSVGPSRITGSGLTNEPTGVDLAMKLHYIKGVYFFSSEASQGLTTPHIKENLFYWCNDYYRTSGRFWRSEDGRPYMKCNDCGVRMIEAQCDKSVEEWIEMRDSSLDHLLIYHHPLGPDLSFSPSLYLQITRFKGGGMSFGMSWAHIIGDPFAISHCINMWGLFLAGLKSYGPLNFLKQPERPPRPNNVKSPLSLKRVNPVGDHWVTANDCKMVTFSLYLTPSKLTHLLSNIWGQTQFEKAPLFESICATMWQFISKVKSIEPKTVTICKKDPNCAKIDNLTNTQIISCVESQNSIIDSDLKKLTKLLSDCAIDERDQIENTVDGPQDYIIYGANLTFINLEGADLYGLEWNKQKPLFVSYSIQGVGDEGAVLVLPWQQNCDDLSNNNGRVVTMVLPEKEATKLKIELKENGFSMNV